MRTGLGRRGLEGEGGRKETVTYNAKMPIHRCDALVCVGLQQLRCDDLLDGQDDAIFAPNADGCAAVFDRLDGVLDLEVPAVGREDGVGEIVACAYRRLEGSPVSLWRGRRGTWSSLQLTIVMFCGWVSRGGGLLGVERDFVARLGVRRSCVVCGELQRGLEDDGWKLQTFQEAKQQSAVDATRSSSCLECGGAGGSSSTSVVWLSRRDSTGSSGSRVISTTPHPLRNPTTQRRNGGVFSN